MTILSRMLKLRRITVDLTPGADPDAIDDVVEAYGDWPEIETSCDAAPAGQCEYSIADPDICIHCKKATGA